MLVGLPEVRRKVRDTGGSWGAGHVGRAGEGVAYKAVDGGTAHGGGAAYG